MKSTTRTPAILALVGSVLGLAFAGYSTYDYMNHLDRQLHDIHCSFIPGLQGSSTGASACKTAMYSAYSALFRETFWGGVPISLFALGVYAFFLAFSISLLVANMRASKRSATFFGLTTLSPLLVSVVMALISAIKLGSFCKTCVGLYISSILLAAGGIWLMVAVRKLSAFITPAVTTTTSPSDTIPDPRASVASTEPHIAFFLVWLVAFGLCVLAPAVVYVAALPDYRPKLMSCGKLPEPQDTAKSLIKVNTTHPKRAATLFIDPLCPTCKALHARLHDEGAFDNLELTVALFPLDNACNWMLDRSLHPGSCVLSRAVICAESRAREALDWMYDEQESLAELGKGDEKALRKKIRDRLGADVEACIDAKATKIKLNAVLQYAVTNHVPVSTPQMYLGDQRVCDEDTDLGLRFTLGKVAPEVLR